MARVESDNLHLLDIDTAKEMVVSFFCDIPWLKRVLLRLLNIDMESASRKHKERVGHVALRSGESAEKSGYVGLPRGWAV